MEADATPQEGTRINKALADAGVCSRRKADELIQSGAVLVNGLPVNGPGARVVAGRDRVTVNGREVAFGTARDAAYAYILLHKPVRVVSTVHDPEGRTTILEVLPPALRTGRLYPVGRLDYFSEGLLLLTDDGELTHRLTHPRWHLDKVYEVRVRGAVSESQLDAMRRGMTLQEGEDLAPVDVRRIERDERTTLLEMTLRQGINRQIRRMCRDLGLTILRLVRVRQGNLELGDLPAGKARALRPAEVAGLRKAAGLDV